MGKIDYKKQNIPFTQVANAVLNDERLSFKAKGLFAYLYSKPNGWDFETSRIAQQSTDGRDSIRSGLRELEAFGYLCRAKLPNGRMVYEVRYPPMTENPSQDQKPMTEKPNDGKSHSGKIRHISNKEKEVIKNISNKESSVQNENAPEVHGVPFEDFWKLYPVKKNKKKASEKWGKLTTEEQQLALADMQTRPSQDNDWLQGYAPHATTYLNGARWEDQYQKIKNKNNNKVHRL